MTDEAPKYDLPAIKDPTFDAVRDNAPHALESNAALYKNHSPEFYELVLLAVGGDEAGAREVLAGVTMARSLRHASDSRLQIALANINNSEVGLSSNASSAGSDAHRQILQAAQTPLDPPQPKASPQPEPPANTYLG